MAKRWIKLISTLVVCLLGIYILSCYLFKNNPRNQIFLGCCFPSKIKNIWCFKPPDPLVGQKKPVLYMKYWHGWLLLKMPSKGLFNSNNPCQYFTWRPGFFGLPKVQEAYNIINFWFLMENSILKFFGSVDVKITPDFCS